VFQVRIHGRGGQGVVTAAEMLSSAAFLEGMHAQAFLSFGSKKIHLRERGAFGLRGRVASRAARRSR
jgi:hypothetical protein